MVLNDIGVCSTVSSGSGRSDKAVDAGLKLPAPGLSRKPFINAET